MSYLPLIDLKNGFWPVGHLLYGISEWNFTDMLNIKGYIFLVRTVTLTFPVHELSALDWSEKWFLTCSSFTIWSIWMKLHRYVDHQRLHIVTKDVISLSISVLLLFRHYISQKITFGAPSSGGVFCSACGAFINQAFYTPWPPIGPGSETLGFDQALVSSFCYKNTSETSFRDIEYVLALRHFLKNRTFEEVST